MHYDDPSAIARELIALRTEHRDIDVLIARLQADPHADQFALARMKKRKLRLKDMIGYLENKLIPDLDA
ncbi:MAG: YdcH family protein [Metallibacterium sp.]